MLDVYRINAHHLRMTPPNKATDNLPSASSGEAMSGEDDKFAQLLSDNGEIGEIARDISSIEAKCGELENRVRAFLAT